MSESSSVVQLKTKNDIIPLVGECSPLVPEGDYTASFLHHETNDKAFGGAKKVYLRFRILDFGEHFEKEVYRAFNVKGLIGKPGKNGRFSLGKRSDLYFQLMKISPNVRADRPSLNRLQNVELKIRVRTVTRDSKQRDLPKQMHYSVVDEILCVLDGDTNE